MEKEQEGMDATILGGDFNIPPDAEELSYLRMIGLRDAAANFTESDLNTWNPERNRENFEYAKEIDFNVPFMENATIKSVVIENDARPRRIDHIFASQNVTERVVEASLFGDVPGGGLIASDHFGLKIGVEI
jgi:endonuclease/exonuclease/phosphatase family metal-dependent hydrolase